jgi:hypothetical protein
MKSQVVWHLGHKIERIGSHWVLDRSVVLPGSYTLKRIKELLK